MSTSFARDYHMRGEIAATKDGKLLGVRVKVLADHGAFNGTAQMSKMPAGLFHVFSGSYDMPAAHCSVTGVYTNKCPGGVAYACSFRITEAVYLIERLVDVLAFDQGWDPAELRMKNLLRPEQFPYRSPLGWEYDSGDYPKTMRVALEMAGYEELRREQASGAPRTSGANGSSSWASACQLLHRGGRRRAAQDDGHPRAGHGRRRGAAGAPHRQGRAAAVVPEPGPGPRDDLRAARRGGAGHRAGRDRRSCRATPTRRRSGWAPTARARPRCPGRDGAGGPEGAGAGADGRGGDAGGGAAGPGVGGGPLPRRAATRRRAKSIAEIAMAAHSDLELPEGVEGHLDASYVYNPPNLTYPYGAYVCVVDVDRGHRAGHGPPVRRGRRLRRADQPDDRRGADPRRPRRRRSAWR